jgi:hypothetical protein
LAGTGPDADPGRGPVAPPAAPPSGHAAAARPDTLPARTTAAGLWLPIVGGLILALAAMLRGAEYDEQYTLFVTGMAERPDWSRTIFPAAEVRAFQEPITDLPRIATRLRQTDVHPPLYFWLAALWRDVFGADLLTLRLLSVLMGAGSLLLTQQLARSLGIAATPAVALALGCYGFVYTGVIARGFALAILLSLAGAVLLCRPRGPRAGLAGLAFGAAVCTNYLAVFAIAGFTAGHAVSGRIRPRAVLRLAGAMTPGLLLAAWFFVAQRGSRAEQFPPFELLPAMLRLARYWVASLLGGLPLYVPAATVLIGVCLAGVAAGLAVLAVRATLSDPARCLGLAGAAIGPPLGLLGLGLLFDNTPIELRYLSFGLPFTMILVAAGLAPGRPDGRWRGSARVGFAALIGVQAASVAGLMLAEPTMQPARRSAQAAARLVPDGVVLLPFGNDGVGIVGAFGIEAPPTQRLLVVRDTDSPAGIRQRLIGERHAAIAALAQDRDSRTVVAVLLGALEGGCWRSVGQADGVSAFTRVCDDP